VVAARLHLVVLRLRAGRTTDGGVGEVHVWWHGGGVCRAAWLRVGEVVG
jgi:hypothetical protein